MKPELTPIRPIYSNSQLQAALRQLADAIQVQEKNGGEFQLIGIHTRGIPLAQRLAQLLGKDPQQIGSLDINLYRDDLSQVAEMPVLRQTKIPFNLDATRVLLIDDVLFTGRTIRSALNAIFDLGRPKNISLAVLIDRGGRELPIQADFFAKKLDVLDQEIVEVRLTEIDLKDEVVIVRKP